MNRNFQCAAILGIALGLFTGCKKNETGHPGNSCRITGYSVHGTLGSGSLTIEYNSAGEISKYFNSSGTTTYLSYSHDTIRIRIFLGDSSASGSMQGKVMATTDQQGNVLNALSTPYDSLKNPIFNHQSEFICTYEGNHQLTQIIDNDPNSGQIQQNFIWQNGNITGIVQDGDTATLDYYSNKLSAQGDFFWVSNLNPLTYENVHVHNLLKSITDAGSTEYITYTFDAQGKIKAFSLSGVVNSDENLTWQCP